MDKSMEVLLKELDDAFLKGDTQLINRINAKIYESLGHVVSNSSIDYDFITNIRGKAVYKTLGRVIAGESLSSNELAKLFSSLVTHIIIECKDSKEYGKYPIKVLLNAIEKLTLEGGDGVDDATEFIKERYGYYFS